MCPILLLQAQRPPASISSQRPFRDVACEGLQTRDDRERKGVQRKGDLIERRRKEWQRERWWGSLNAWSSDRGMSSRILNSRMLAGCLVTPNTPCRPLRPQPVVEECAHTPTQLTDRNNPPWPPDAQGQGGDRLAGMKRESYWIKASLNCIEVWWKESGKLKEVCVNRLCLLNFENLSWVYCVQSHLHVHILRENSFCPSPDPPMCQKDRGPPYPLRTSVGNPWQPRAAPAREINTGSDCSDGGSQRCSYKNICCDLSTQGCCFNTDKMGASFFK